MGYRKIQANNIFDGEKIRNKPEVLICSENGSIEAIIPAADAGEGIQHLEGMLCPGFVNTHCHLELSHMKNMIPTHTGMVDFLLNVMTQRTFPPNLEQEAMQKADQEMYRNGIVVVGDISNNTSSLQTKAVSELVYHTFVETAGFVPAGAQGRFEAAEAIYNAFAAQFGPNWVSLVPHAPYSVSHNLFQRINAVNKGKTISIHNQESQAENALYEDKTGHFLRLYETMGLPIDFFSPSGKTSLATYLPWLSNPQGLLLVHNVVTNRQDIRLAQALATERKQDLYWCLCPQANEYIQGALPPVSLLMEENCTITLGTDSLASNHQLNILAEIQLLQNKLNIPLETALQWATINGAKALGLEEVCGNFKKAKMPGILLLKGVENKLLQEQVTVERIV